jgi:hypothetical protein
MSVIPKDLWASLYGLPGSQRYNLETGGQYKPYHELYASNVREAILTRVKRPWEAIVCCTWGGAQRAVGGSKHRPPRPGALPEVGTGQLFPGPHRLDV